MIQLASEGSYGKQLASAGVRGKPKPLDYIRINEWRKLKDAGAEPMRAFVTVATHPEYGFSDMKGMAGVEPSKVVRRFARFAERMRLPEWERARDEASLALAGMVTDAAATVGEMIRVRDFATPSKGDAARVALASSKIALEAAGIIGAKGGGTVVNVAALAQASAGPSTHDVAAKIAADPEASAAMATLLSRIDPPET